MADPRNGLESLGINFLLAVQALAERAFTDPFQRGVHGSQQGSVTRFLTEVYQRRIRAIALVLAVVMLCGPLALFGRGSAGAHGAETVALS